MNNIIQWVFKIVENEDVKKWKWLIDRGLFSNSHNPLKSSANLSKTNVTAHPVSVWWLCESAQVLLKQK